MPLSRAFRSSFALLAIWTLGNVTLYGQDSSFVACLGELVRIRVQDGIDYVWTPSAGIADPTSRTAAFVATADATYSVTFRRVNSNNLVQNGDFELGNTGFTSAYRHVPGGTFDRGTYAVMANPRNFNVGFASCRDPENPGGRMMVADGSEVAGARVWCQTVPVAQGREYGFRIFLTSLVGQNPPRMQFTINGETLGPAEALVQPCDWRQFYTTWVAPDVATAEICVVNNNTSVNGNDFALDAISFVELGETITRDFSVTVAQPGTNTITAPLCPGQRYSDNGLDLGIGESGTFTTRTNKGCDSVVTVNTTASLPKLTEEIINDVCPGDIVGRLGIAIKRDTVITRTGFTVDGCDSTYTLTVKYFNETALDTTLRRPSCPGDADGRIDIEIIAGVPPYQIRWDDGTSAAFRQNLRAGTYRLTVTDANGCVAERAIVLEDPEGIDVRDLTTTPAACADQANGAVSVSPTGGTGELRIGVTARDTDRRFDPNRLAAGEYTLRVTDELGCFAERPFLITAPLPIELQLSGDTVLRLGETGRYFATIDGEDVTLAWFYNGANVDSLVANNALQARLVSGGQLLVVATDRNGCERQASLNVRVRAGGREFFPSAFSPNEDGVNDTFGPVEHPAIAVVERFDVYNRWGGLVFARSNCPAGSLGSVCAWSGQIDNVGAFLDGSVFVYVSRVRLIDGSVVDVEGEVSLVR